MARSELPPTRSSSSDEEEEPSSEGSESESDPPPKKPGKADPNIKPLASKPMDDDDPPRKPRSKNPILRYSPPPIKSSTGKRAAAATADGEARGSKRAKNDEEKKQLFQRVWSEEDEIELIKGMISYVEKKGKDPIGDISDFHDFVKKSLTVDVDHRQTSAKVRRLRRKFLDNVGRIEKQGKVRAFSKPHEKKMYDLSKRLWGCDGNKDELFVSCSSKKVDPKSQRDSKPLVDGNGGLEASPIEVEKNDIIGLRITDEEIMKRGIELASDASKAELEEKWKNLKVLQMEHFVKKLELLKEQAEIVLNALKKPGGGSGKL